MEHQMKLNESPFDRIRSGIKRIEIRLFDEKRQTLNIGDIITFSKLPNLNESFPVKIISLLRYKTFQDFVDNFPMKYFWYSDNHNKQIFIESIYQIYSKEEE